MRNDESRRARLLDGRGSARRPLSRTYVLATETRATEPLRNAGELLDVELLDHIIIGQGRCVSMKERRLGF